MVNKKKWLGILVLVLVFGMTVVGCEGGSDIGDGNDNSRLPSASGVNAVGGKTYYESSDRTVFSITADSATNGTYVVTTIDNGTYAPGVKYTYTTQIETGTYSWNEEAKTVTVKPEMVAFRGSTYVDGSDGSETHENENGALKNKTGYRSEVQASLDAFRNEYGQEAVNQMLSSMGFSSVSAYLDLWVNGGFANRTRAYSFSTDGTALFLENPLPANKGTNEFSGQTYSGLGSRVDDKYVFTASGYTYTGYSVIITGSYAYDSSQKQVWLKPSTINGENRAAYYATNTAYPGHRYPDDYADRAVSTNKAFSVWDEMYNSTNKTIGNY
jgi:hypothetical protein